MFKEFSNIFNFPLASVYKAIILNPTNSKKIVCVSWRQDMMYCDIEEERRNISRMATEREEERERERERGWGGGEGEHCRINNTLNYYII